MPASADANSPFGPFGAILQNMFSGAAPGAGAAGAAGGAPPVGGFLQQMMQQLGADSGDEDEDAQLD